eukprot:g30568.t1
MYCGLPFARAKANFGTALRYFSDLTYKSKVQVILDRPKRSTRLRKVEERREGGECLGRTVVVAHRISHPAN